MKPPSKDDFPDPADPRVDLFIEWVRLCEIIGRVAKQLPSTESGAPKIQELTSELVKWVASLPGSMQIRVHTEHSSSLARDTHHLHLPYLATISLLYLRRSSEPLPTASIAAIVAACYVADIFESYLARGSLHFLTGQNGWYITIAILALLHARRVEAITATADAHIRTLRIALKQMAQNWYSAQIFDVGLDKLPGIAPNTVEVEGEHMRSCADAAGTSPSLDELRAEDATDWKVFFPHVSSSTNALVKIILDNEMSDPWARLDWPLDLNTDFSNLFEQCEDFNTDAFNMPY